MAAMWQAIIGGAFAGLVLSALIGPIFFALLQTSIEKGFLTGLVFAFGIITCDSFFFLLAYLGISQLGNAPYTHEIMGLAGGIFLLIFGMRLILKKKREKQGIAIHIKKKNILRNYLKGFFMNALNPAVFLYWVGVVTAVSAQYRGDGSLIFSFFIGAMSVVFTTDVLKAFLAVKLKRIVNDHFMHWLNRISGSVLVIAGIKLLFDAVKLLFVD